MRGQRRKGAGRAGWLVFVRQQERGHAPVALGDYPKRVLPEAFARLPGVYGIGGKDAPSAGEGLVVCLLVLRADISPIAGQMADEAFLHVNVGTGFESAGRGDKQAKLKARFVTVRAGDAVHVGFSFV